MSIGGVLSFWKLLSLKGVLSKYNGMFESNGRSFEIMKGFGFGVFDGSLMVVLFWICLFWKIICLLIRSVILSDCYNCDSYGYIMKSDLM